MVALQVVPRIPQAAAVPVLVRATVLDPVAVVELDLAVALVAAAVPLVPAVERGRAAHRELVAALAQGALVPREVAAQGAQVASAVRDLEAQLPVQSGVADFPVAYQVGLRVELRVELPAVLLVA